MYDAVYLDEDEKIDNIDSLYESLIVFLYGFSYVLVCIFLCILFFLLNYFSL